MEKWPSRPKLISNKFTPLGALDKAPLEALFTNDEIKCAVWACRNEKAPGPNRFSFQFIKKYWAEMQEDVINVVKYFENYGRLGRGCNSSFITLVPKIKDPLTLGDYRPISLIGCLYKIIAKMLACRLKGVIV